MTSTLEEARSVAKEFMKVVPNLSIKEWARTEPYTDPDEPLATPVSESMTSTLPRPDCFMGPGGAAVSTDNLN